MPPAVLLSLTALAADPWSRPEHLRASTPPPTRFSDLDAARLPIRLWWDGDEPVEVQALLRGRWRATDSAVRYLQQGRHMLLAAALPPQSLILAGRLARLGVASLVTPGFRELMRERP